MKFAEFEGARHTATPGARGACPACGADMIAKCGPKVIWHWSHKGRKHCDHWWENETEWHRAWKNRFPNEWAEVVQRSPTGERHIADIKNNVGRVIEFQHSPIGIDERWAREEFYGDMVWVVDGTRLKRDSITFHAHIQTKKFEYLRGMEVVKLNPHVPKITTRWIDSTVPVYLDFGDDHLWSISGETERWYRFASRIPKDEFVEAIRAGRNPTPEQIL